MKKNITILAVIIVGGVFLHSCGNNQQELPTSFTEVTVERGSVKDIVSTTGIVEPQNRLEIMPAISGRIEEVYVKEGQTVTAGDALASMSSTDRAALLDAAKSEGAEKVKYWQEVYKPTSLIAPINGKVIVRAIEPGQTINTSSTVLVLADKLIVKAQVDETDIGKVKSGQKVLITLDAYPDISVAGVVDNISYESETVNNVTIYEVDIVPSRVPTVFRSGMSANVDIIKQQKVNVLLISESALIDKNGEKFVLVKTDTKPLLVAVTTGLSQEGKIEIISGLTEGQTVLIRQESASQTKVKKSTSFFQRPGSNRKK